MRSMRPIPRSPRVGDQVHYVLSTGAHRPAIVIQPFSPLQAALAIFTFPGEDTTFARAAEFSPDHMPGTWHWPEK